MHNLNQLINCEFTKKVFKDGDNIFKEMEIEQPAINLPDNIDFDEYQYYIHKVGFYLTHTITWCKQLNFALDFISNYNYSQKNSSTRADHLIYNIENYLMRLNSIYDRVLQIVNAVFHLCISEEMVNHGVILTNYKVQHRTEIYNELKKLSKFFRKFKEDRNTIIHRHSYMDLELRRIELFYMADLVEKDNYTSELKKYRSMALKKYISSVKEDFSNINDNVFNNLNCFFNKLVIEYENVKKRLK